MRACSLGLVGLGISLGLVLGIGLVLGLAHFTFCQPASVRARILPISAAHPHPRNFTRTQVSVHNTVFGASY